MASHQSLSLSRHTLSPLSLMAPATLTHGSDHLTQEIQKIGNLSRIFSHEIIYTNNLVDIKGCFEYGATAFVRWKKDWKTCVGTITFHIVENEFIHVYLFIKIFQYHRQDGRNCYITNIFLFSHELTLLIALTIQDNKPLALATFPTPIFAIIKTNPLTSAKRFCPVDWRLT